MIREAGCTLQTGTVSVERLWATMEGWFPAAAQTVSPAWWDVLSQLIFLRYNFMHYTAVVSACSKRVSVGVRVGERRLGGRAGGRRVGSEAGTLTGYFVRDIRLAERFNLLLRIVPNLPELQHAEHLRPLWEPFLS